MCIYIRLQRCPQPSKSNGLDSVLWNANVILQENFCGRMMHMLHCKVFGSIPYMHVMEEMQTELDCKNQKCLSLVQLT